SLAVDNKYISAVDGSEQSATNFAYTGFIPVISGITYTISTQHNSFGGGTYWKGDERLSNFTVNDILYTFTPPHDCTHVTFNLRMATDHTNADFLQTINSIQLEIGMEQTSYVPYELGTFLKSDN